MVLRRDRLYPVFFKVQLDDGDGADEVPVDGTECVIGIDFDIFHKSALIHEVLPLKIRIGILYKESLIRYFIFIITNK